MECLAIAGHDEERVVDAHTKADHRNHLRGEVGHLTHVAEQPNDARAKTETDERCANRQAHGEH